MKPTIGSLGGEITHEYFFKVLVFLALDRFPPTQVANQENP